MVMQIYVWGSKLNGFVATSLQPHFTIMHHKKLEPPPHHMCQSYKFCICIPIFVTHNHSLGEALHEPIERPNIGVELAEVPTT